MWRAQDVSGADEGFRTRHMSKGNSGGIPDGGQGWPSAILALMVEPPEMRASDADRERISAVLRDAHAEGRLPQDELLERIGAAFQAQTYRELDRLVADIPPPQRQVSPRPVQPAAAKTAQPAKPRTGMSGFLVVNWWLWGCAVAINLVVWFLVSISGPEPAYFWPMWVAGPWGALLGVWTAAEREVRRRKAG